MTRTDITALRYWITVAGIILVALIIAVGSYETWQDYRATISANERSQLGLSRALAEQTERMVQEVDLVLGSYADWVVSSEGRAADGESMRARLRYEIRHLPFVYSASVVGAEGQVLATTQDDPVANANFKTRLAFTVPQRDQNNALYIGQPFIGSRDGRETFVLSRRINDAGGVFSGVVIARVSLDYLAGFYAGVSITPDSTIRLVKEDGVVLAQYPQGDATISDNLYVQQNHAALQTTEQVHRESAAGQPERIVALHKAADYPILIEVARPVAGVLQPWVQTELASAARTLTLALLAAALLIALRAALKRHARSEHERRRLEHELESAHRAQALGLLAASVVHDFNNVLSAIVGYGELVHKTVAAGSPARINIDRLLGATERARLLVRRVLTFNPHRSVNYQPLSIKPIVAEVLQQLQATLPPSVTVQTSGMEISETIFGDATEVYQVVMNLCSNALHAMPSGGTLELRLQLVEVLEARSLALGQLHPGRWLCLLIIDTGVGLAAEQLTSIFEPFYTTRESGQGTGIGLTVVRNIILGMNGALDVDSRLGSGTRISVYWPLVESEDVPVADLPKEGNRHGNGQTILVVDDNAELVMLAEELLASLGYEPVGFTGAYAALGAFQRDPGRFDAVLTDERMHPLRGCDLAQLIHDIEPAMPIILMTGHHDDDIDQRARQAGIATILDKPLRIETLQSALSQQSSLERTLPALE